MAEPAAAESRSPPMNQASSLALSSQRTCGARSPHREDRRDVHRSYGSMTWVSTSMIGMSLIAAPIGPSSSTALMRAAS